MSKVFLNKQDTLVVQIDEVLICGKQIPLTAEVEYDDIILLIQKKSITSGHKSRKSKNLGTQISRKIGLLCRAIETGKWSTGVPMDPSIAASKLIDTLCRIPNDEIDNLTPNAIKGLNRVVKKLPELRDFINGVISK